MAEPTRSLLKRVMSSRPVWLLVGLAVGGLAEPVARAAHDLGTIDKARRYLGAELKAPLEKQTVDPSWILEGQPHFSVSTWAQSPLGTSSAGVWKVEGPTRFEWQFGRDETVYILEGAVNIDWAGKTYALGPGDSAFFPAGARATWHVPERLFKSFTLEEPGRVTRLARKLF
jgi:uncharacterized cupin superfamily protein